MYIMFLCRLLLVKIKKNDDVNILITIVKFDLLHWMDYTRNKSSKIMLFFTSILNQNVVRHISMLHIIINFNIYQKPALR